MMRACGWQFWGERLDESLWWRRAWISHIGGAWTMAAFVLMIEDRWAMVVRR